MKRLHFFLVILLIILFGAFYFFSTKKDLSTLDFIGEEKSALTPSVFVDRVPSENMERLTMEDFPANLEAGYHQSVVAHKERFYVAGMHHILEYDAQGNLLAMTDRAQIDCAFRLAVIGDALYAACMEDGIYEINLLTRSLAYHFDKSNGLSELRNLYPVADGNTLWVVTFDGLAKIDAKSREVMIYRDELGANCSQYNVYSVMVNAGDVWAHVIADAECSGGLAHYIKEEDQWVFYDIKHFNQIDLSSIFFHRVMVTDEGVYAQYQDGGPDHEILSFFDRSTEKWIRLVDTEYKNIDRDITPRLPSQEETQMAYFDEEQNIQTWHVPVDGQWKIFPLTLHRYFTFFPGVKETEHRLENEERYFLTSAGLERFRKGDRFPEILLQNPIAFTHARILTTDDERYVVAVSNDAGEMMCQVNTYAVFVHDRLSEENRFVNTIEADRLKRPLGTSESCYDLASIQLVWEDGNLFLADEEGVVIEIVLARSLIKPLE